MLYTKKKGNDFEKFHYKNLGMLNSIKSSNFYTKLRGDRDKKFGHADSDYPTPFSFHSFYDEIKIAFEQLIFLKR